jgi:hypothetical protein
MLHSVGHDSLRLRTLWRTFDSRIAIPGLPGKSFAVAGFEDILEQADTGHTLLGQGRYYNSPISVNALVGVIINTNNPVAMRTIDDESIPKGREVIRKLREEQVLAGMRILDLGCGVIPGFALAAKALGAEVQTADMQPLPSKASALLDGHIQTDLSHPDAPSTIFEASNPPYDFINQGIIGHTPETATMGFELPEMETIYDIADMALRAGGVLFNTFSGKSFQKIEG